MRALAVDEVQVADAARIPKARLVSFLHGVAVPDINEAFRLAYSLDVRLRDLGVGVRR